jgi:hypothetical protein
MRLFLAGVAVLVGFAIGGCGTASSPPSTSTVPGTTASAAQGASAARSEATGVPSPEEQEPVVPGLHISGPEGHSQGAKEVCERLSVEELEATLTIEQGAYGSGQDIHPKPLPVHPVKGLTQFSCGYEDADEQLWLSDGFTQSEESVEEAIRREERTEGERRWIPIEVAGFPGYYTPGIFTGRNFLVELVLQIEPGLYFGLSPYKTAGAPGSSVDHPEAPPYVQEEAEELAAAILS